MIASIMEAMNLYMTERCLQRVQREDALWAHLHLRVTGIIPCVHGGCSYTCHALTQECRIPVPKPLLMEIFYLY